jgi:hypothetical protein
MSKQKYCLVRIPSALAAQLAEDSEDLSNIVTALVEEHIKVLKLQKLNKRRRKILSKSEMTVGDEKKLESLESKIKALGCQMESPEDAQAMKIIQEAAELLTPQISPNYPQQPVESVSQSPQP